MSCKFCDGTGRVLKAIDEEKFEKYFDLYSSQFGALNGKEMALKKVGYTSVPCAECNIGLIKDGRGD